MNSTPARSSSPTLSAGSADLKAAAAGDPQAQARLLRRHLLTMRAVARRLCWDAADAEDAVQDACLLALTRLHQIREAEGVRPWLHAVVANAARMQHRRRRTRPAQGAGRGGDAVLCELRDPAALPDERCYQKRQLEALRGAWLDLGAEQRAALELREVQGLSFAEAAARLRTTPQAVKTRVCRTRALLKAKLG